MRKGPGICYKRTMSRIRLMPAFVLLSLSLLLSVNSRSAENGCISCHQQPDFYAQYPRLHEYYQQYAVSPHERAGVTCDLCHGGEPKANSVKEGHVGVWPMNSENSTVHYQNQPETCGQCHDDKRAQFIQSKHYAALMGQRTAPTCSTCHPAMSQRPELRKIVLNACRSCHYEKNSDNLPLIADQAEDIFSNLNIAGGLLGWTRIHYESHDWPDGSRRLVQQLESQHGHILNLVHQFDLEQTEDAVTDLLGQLRDIFEQTRSASEQPAN